MYRIVRFSLFLLMQAVPVLGDPSDLCLTAARQTASEFGVPPQILVSLTLTETGRTSNGDLRPWPWAINHAGTGHWFDTKDQAITFAQDLVQRGQRNFDMGCFQVNYRWHGDQFPSLEAAFSPDLNARYAAGYLHSLYQDAGNWVLAAAYYHSRTPEYRERYLARFETILATIQDAPQPIKPVSWFASTGATRLGSLVVLGGHD